MLLHLMVTQFQEQLEFLSSDAKDAAAYIDRRLQLGSKLSDVMKNREDAVALFDLYKSEAYILTELEGRYCVRLSSLHSLYSCLLFSVFMVNSSVSFILNQFHFLQL